MKWQDFYSNLIDILNPAFPISQIKRALGIIDVLEHNCKLLSSLKLNTTGNAAKLSYVKMVRNRQEHNISSLSFSNFCFFSPFQFNNRVFQETLVPYPVVFYLVPAYLCKCPWTYACCITTLLMEEFQPFPF